MGNSSPLFGLIGFSEYYQIVETTQHAGSSGEEELIPIGMNSLFGIVAYSQKELGLSYHEIMYEMSWACVQMMLTDMPRVVKKEQIVQKISGRELFGMLGK